MPALERLRSSLWLILVAHLALAAPLSAAPASTGDVEGLIRKGSELRKQGKDSQALPFYQRAYDESPTGRTAAQLGLCEVQLGYFLPASDHLTQALASEGDPWVEKYRHVLEQSLHGVKSHLAEVTVTGSPPGAEVLVDDKVVGRLPLAAPLRVTAGPARKIALRAPGYEQRSETVTARGGESVDVALQLPKLAPQESTAPAHPEPTTATPARDAEPEKGPSASGLRVAAWSATAGAAVLLAVGGVEMYVASKRLSDFRSTRAQNDPTRTCGTDQAQDGGGNCQSLHDSWQSARTVGLVGLVGGGALAVGSGVLWYLSTSSDAKDSKVACALQLGRAGVVCAGRF